MVNDTRETESGDKEQVQTVSENGRQDASGKGAGEKQGSIFETEDLVEIIPPSAQEQRHTPTSRRKDRKKEFNPWVELDKASKKTVSRRDLITGIFRFLPKKEDR